MTSALFQISEPGASKPKAACAIRVVGIDLGTTNSLVAVVREGRPYCIQGADGVLMPSVVHYGLDGGVVVGREARDRLAARYPDDTIASVKRFMGRGPEDAEATRRLTPYQIAPPAPGDTIVRFLVAGGRRKVTPIEVSSEILRVLKARAEVELGGPVGAAVITVPAYFDDAQRQATRDAGRLAGLDVLRLVNEPTAAALAYGLDRQAEGTFAVFDLGGGTFDISILKLEDGVFEVKSTGGDSALGGDDFDRVIAGWILDRMARAADAGGDRSLARRVLDTARAAREALTDAEDTAIAIDGFAGRLSRTGMETLCKPVLDRCGPPCRRALRDAGLEAKDLSGVVLVGGVTRMGIVRRFVRDLFARDPLGDIDPDEVVALGAAAQADALAGGPGAGEFLLLDVVPLSLGIETMGGVVEKIIPRNSTVPCGAAQTFTTYSDKQTGFDLHVVQGEREMVSECRSLARFKLGGIPPMPAGLARLDVTFLVDADGILRVLAKEQTTGKEAQIQVKPTYGLTDDEVERMLLDAYAHGEEDIRRRALAEQRVEASRIEQAARAAMADTPDLLTEADRTAIEAAMKRLDAAAAGEDAEAIGSAVSGLDAASKDFAARRMDRAMERGLRGRAAAEIEAKADADIARHGRVHGYDSAARRPDSRSPDPAKREREG